MDMIKWKPILNENKEKLLDKFTEIYTELHGENTQNKLAMCIDIKGNVFTFAYITDNPDYIPETPCEIPTLVIKIFSGWDSMTFYNSSTDNSDLLKFARTPEEREFLADRLTNSFQQQSDTVRDEFPEIYPIAKAAMFKDAMEVFEERKIRIFETCIFNPIFK